MSDVANIVAPSLEHDPVRRALDCLSEGFQIWRFFRGRG